MFRVSVIDESYVGQGAGEEESPYVRKSGKTVPHNFDATLLITTFDPSSSEREQIFDEYGEGAEDVDWYENYISVCVQEYVTTEQEEAVFAEQMPDGFVYYYLDIHGDENLSYDIKDRGWVKNREDINVDYENGGYYEDLISTVWHNDVIVNHNLEYEQLPISNQSDKEVVEQKREDQRQRSTSTGMSIHIPAIGVLSLIALSVMGYIYMYYWPPGIFSQPTTNKKAQQKKEVQKPEVDPAIKQYTQAKSHRRGIKLAIEQIYSVTNDERPELSLLRVRFERARRSYYDAVVLMERSDVVGEDYIEQFYDSLQGVSNIARRYDNDEPPKQFEFAFRMLTPSQSYINTSVLKTTQEIETELNKLRSGPLTEDYNAARGGDWRARRGGKYYSKSIETTISGRPTQAEAMYNRFIAFEGYNPSLIDFDLVGGVLETEGTFYASRQE